MNIDLVDAALLALHCPEVLEELAAASAALALAGPDLAARIRAMPVDGHTADCDCDSYCDPGCSYCTCATEETS